MSDFTHVQYCLDCKKIRFTDPNHVWNHWQMPTVFHDKFVQEAQQVTCNHCKQKQNAELRQQKGW